MSDRTQDKVADAADSAKKDLQNAGAKAGDAIKDGVDSVKHATGAETTTDKIKNVLTGK